VAEQVVVIGAVALGPKAACRFKRLRPQGRVIMIDQGERISYGGCGIPYFVSGDVSDPGELQSTSFHMLRDVKFFKEAKDIEVLTGTRALAIDRAGKTVRIRHEASGKEESLPYDRLVLATGSRPVRLPLRGSQLQRVHTVGDLEDGIMIKESLARGEVEKAVIVGAGAIGLEMAEALTDLWGVETTVVEIKNQILPELLSPTLARMAQLHMEEKGVRFRLSEQVHALEGRERVERVVTGREVLEADMVIMAAGVVPNGELARACGLEVSERGAVKVNDRLQSSDPDIYAGGDCVEVRHLITGEPAYFPSGSLANRQGRVIGTNLAGGDARFEGIVGSFVAKLFDVSVAGSGLSAQAALRKGFDPIRAFVVQFDRAHFYPEKELLYMELVVDRPTNRVLGIQGLGGRSDSLVARINAVAAILKYGPTPADIGNLEIPYAPPFSAAMDILNALGNTAENILAGRNRVLDPDDFLQWWESRHEGDLLFLDCRAWGNAEPYVRRHPDCWVSIPQDELRIREDEVPRDKRLVLICNTGVRSYEAQLTLDEMGIEASYNLQGGVAALKKLGLEP